jgi:hypothetical protein
MPARTLQVDGREWQVYPSGFLTQYVGDEYGLIFVYAQGAEREVRVTRYSPMASARGTGREASLALMGEQELVALFRTSQPGERSPEAGYRS